MNWIAWALLLGGVGLHVPAAEREAPLPLWAQPVVLYLESLSKPDGGYGWSDQPFGHLSATWAVVGTYEIVGRKPPHREELIEFINVNHPFDESLRRSIAHAAELRTFVYQQIQSLQWLGGDLEPFRPTVSQWTVPTGYPRFYELRGYPVFQEEVMGLLSRELLGLPSDELSPGLLNQIVKRMRSNGTFNNTSATDGTSGHVVNTLWGLLATRYMGGAPSHVDKLVGWLEECQTAGGGFVSHPARSSSRANVFFTWAGIRALEICDAMPLEKSRVVRFLLRHWQDDGGFSWYESGRSDPLATYYALDTLRRLGELESLENHLRQPRPEPADLPDDLQVFSIQINAPGQGSPRELIRLAKSLKIHHWLARNGVDGYREELEVIAKQENVPVVFDKCQEDYQLYLGVPGIGEYARTSLIMIPGDAEELNRHIERSAPWVDYRKERRRSLDRVRGLLAWNVCDNEVYARSVLDDSIELGGYDLINVFHFGGWDLLVNFPWLRNYSGRVPLVAVSNAQGAQAWWWADRLASFRTLYLGKEASWESWLTAVEKNWVVAVRLNEDGGKPLVYGGAPGVREIVVQRESEWKWWREGHGSLRPAVSLVAVKPGDAFESPVAEKQVVLRVRTWWWTDASGYPKKQRSELSRLLLNGVPVEPRFVEHRNLEDRVVDCYYRYDAGGLRAGRHIATAEVEVIASGVRHSQSIEFEVE